MTQRFLKMRSFHFQKALTLTATTVAATLGILSAASRPASALQIFTNLNDYETALTNLNLSAQIISEDFSVDPSPTLDPGTFIFDSGIQSTQDCFPNTTGCSGGNGNRQDVNTGNGRYTSFVRTENGVPDVDVVWELPMAVSTFSFEIQGTNQPTFAIEGDFDGTGTQTIVFQNPFNETGPNFGASLNSASFAFFGLIGDSTFDQFRFYDTSGVGNSNAYNFQIRDFSANVPTPALLPGLIGMGVAAIRKRNKLASGEDA